MNVRNFFLRQQSNELGIVNGAQHSRCTDLVLWQFLMCRT